MRTDSALQLIDTLVYFPGWSFTATDHTNRFEGSILLRIDYPAYNTNRQNAIRGYDETIETYATFPIVVADITEASQLYRKVAECLRKLYDHEMREALRVLPDYWAPFHPHNVDGMRRWNAAAVTDQDILPDLQFGIA